MTQTAAQQINEYLGKIESERFNVDYLDHAKQARETKLDDHVRNVLNDRRRTEKTS